MIDNIPQVSGVLFLFLHPFFFLFLKLVCLY